MLARGAVGLRQLVRPIAFGNALGSSIADSMQGGVDWSKAPDESAAESARLERTGNPYAYWPDETTAETARLERSGDRYAYWPDETEAEGARLLRNEATLSHAAEKQREDTVLWGKQKQALAANRRAAAARDRQWIAQDDAIMDRRAAEAGAAGMRVGPTIERARALGLTSAPAVVASTSPGAYISATKGDGLLAADRYLKEHRCTCSKCWNSRGPGGTCCWSRCGNDIWWSCWVAGPRWTRRVRGS